MANTPWVKIGLCLDLRIAPLNVGVVLKTMSVNSLTNQLGIDDFIIELMRIRQRHLQLDQLKDLVAQLQINSFLLTPHIHFCNTGYTRNLLCRTSRFDMLVLCWLPGQMTAIHDHAGSLNVTRVCSGTLTARLFQVRDRPVPGRAFVELKMEQQLGENELSLVERNDIHQLANMTEQKLVTLHVYAPPLRNITVYNSYSGLIEPVALRYTLEDDFA